MHALEEQLRKTTQITDALQQQNAALMQQSKLQQQAQVACRDRREQGHNRKVFVNITRSSGKSPDCRGNQRRG